MKQKKLDAEEEGILRAYEAGALVRSKTSARDVAMLRSAARATLRKDKRINIRMSEQDLLGIQAKAVEEGLPYQTFISSILHKYVRGTLVERRSA